MNGSLLALGQGSGESPAGIYHHGISYLITLYRFPTAGPNMSNTATTTIAINRRISAYSTNPCPSSRGKKSIAAPPSFARLTREESRRSAQRRRRTLGNATPQACALYNETQQSAIVRSGYSKVTREFRRHKIRVNVQYDSTGSGFSSGSASVEKGQRGQEQVLLEFSPETMIGKWGEGGFPVFASLIRRQCLPVLYHRNGILLGARPKFNTIYV